MAMIENDNPDFWFTKYKYYSSPDGTDIRGKILSFVYPAIQGSMFIGLHDIMIRYKCKTYAHALQRMAFWMIPMTGIAAAYPAVTYMSTRVRGKDDPFNHAMGALSTVPIFKAWWKLHFPACFQLSFALMWFAVFIKGFRGEYAPPVTKYDLRPLTHVQYD